MDPSSGHGRAASTGPGGRLPRPVLLHGRRLLLRRGRGGRPRRGGPALLPRAQPRRGGGRGFREREARRGRQGGESPSLVCILPSLLSPFLAFAFAPTKLARVLCAKLLARLCRIGRPCSSPGFSRRCSAVVCSRPNSAPARLPRYYARTAAEVWKSCVFSWLVAVFPPPNHAISFCFLVGF